MCKCKWSAFIVLLASIATAQQVPPTMFGMNVHPKVIAPHNGIPWPTIPIGAFRFWGTETTWSAMNPSNGAYNFDTMDAWFAAAAKNGVTDFLYTFGETPAWAAGPPMTQSCDHYPGSCDAPKDLNADGTGPDQIWKDFVTVVVKHANGRIKYWEVWNEPDIGIEWTPTNPQMPYAQLIRMAKDAYAIIKANCPTCQVTTPCPVDSGKGQTIGNWLPGYVKAGGLAYADIIAFHGYIDSALGQKPEAEAGKVATIKAAIGNSTKPIWDTEGNWGNDSGLPNAQLQAAYLARMYLVQRSVGVQRFYWWQYGNSEMGTLVTNGTLTSSGTAYAELNKWIVGSTMTKPCMNSGTVWSCGFRMANGTQSMIVWDAGQTCAVTNCGQTQWSYPAGYTASATLAGVNAKLSGGKVGIGAQPILLMGSTPLGNLPQNALVARSTGAQRKVLFIDGKRKTSSAKATLTAGATSSTPEVVNLLWNASSSPNVLAYNVYRNTAATGGFTEIGSIPSSSCCNYKDSTTIFSTSYWYAVTASDVAVGTPCPTGQTCESAEDGPIGPEVIPGPPPPPPPPQPNPPTGLTGTVTTSKNVILKWNQPVPQVGVQDISTSVYMCYQSGCPKPPIIATVLAPAATYTAKCTYPGGRCWYVLKENAMVNGKSVQSVQSNIVAAKVS
jgi:hypothetical protein